MFADRAKIAIVSGKGGDGHVSFRREKYVAAGGPDGGDGGNGGSIVFEVDEGLNTLAAFRHKYKFKAGDGQEGGKKRCHGKDGQDIILKVPEGTVIMDAASGKVIADMSGDNKRQVILKGGRGGKGNMNFATPTMQVPKFAQPGQPSRELEVRLELKLIADVGLVGFPSVGKSTFLSRVSNAQPKIAAYHFTTLVPNLGVVDVEGCNGFVIADIPGLIEGASEGAGLGDEFLRHIERCRMLIHEVDAAGSEGRDPIEDIYKINNELSRYSERLANLPQVIAANKTDLIFTEEGEEDPVEKIRKEFEPKGYRVFPISAATGKGLKELLYYVQNRLDEIPKDEQIFVPEFDPEEMLVEENLPYTVEIDPDDPHTFIVEGPKIDKMLGYTNLDSEKGFQFFQKFLKDSGILNDLEEAGIKDGDTVRMYGLHFEYYK
uniref:GTPase ObgE n=1 Tax=Eubacterium cellulosolvens TaxID=29322 RepID=UPI0004862205|nr:GTPase ObgE [[Eubacterium] cellulosolvens]